MNSSFQIVLIANAIAFAATAIAAKARTDSAPALPVHLYDAAHVPRDVVRAASLDAGLVFRAARILIDWQSPASESPEDLGTDMTAFPREPDTRHYLVVRLIRGMPARVLPGALGYSLPFATRGAHVIIFYDRVETLASALNESTYIVLGHAIAHEIGHVLFGSSEHTKRGLMQADWSLATWRLASRGLLSFTPDDIERLRAGMRRIQGSAFFLTSQYKTSRKFD